MDSQDIGATWREWTNLLARVRFGTQRVAGKSISGFAIKSVGERVATYADRDGTRVRPGIARIAVDLETSHTQVRNAITVLERVGLLELLAAGTRRYAAVYRLVIPTDLLDRTDVELWSPARHTLAIKELADKYRGRSKTPETLTPQESALWDETLTPQESSIAVVDLPNADPSGSENPETLTPEGVETLTPQGSATNQRPNHTPDQPTVRDLRTELTPPRARDPDPNPEVSPPKCHHGLMGGQRPDGEPNCPICRRLPKERAA